MKTKQVIMGIIGLIIMQSASAAASCANGAGTEIKGNDHGTYCLSKASMNWWSAHAWCDAIGMKLVPLNECECNDEANCDTEIPTVQVECPSV